MKPIKLLLVVAALTTEFKLGAVRAFGDPPAQRAASSARPQSEPGTHLDRYGDPLPARAVCRLGTLRLLHRDFVTNAAFSPDGRRFASTAVDGTLVVWDWPCGKTLHQFPYSTSELHGLQFSPDNRYLAGFDGKSFVIWDLNSDRPLFRSEAYRYPVFSPDSKRIAWLKDAHSLRVLALGAGKEPETAIRPHDVRALGYDKDGHLRIVENHESMLSLRDHETDRQIVAIDLRADPLQWVEFASDGSSFAVYTRKTGITLRNTRTGEQLGRLAKLPDKSAPATLSRDGKKILLTGGTAAGFQIWNLESGKKVCAIDLSAGDGGVRIGAFSPDGKLLAVGGTNHPHAASFWDTSTGERVERFAGHRSLISAVAFSPNGAEIATCSLMRRDPVVRIWDVKTGRRLRSFEAHPFGVCRVVYTPDGTRLITCGLGGPGAANVRVWDARTLKQVRRMKGPPYGAGNLAVSADGERVVAVRTGTTPDEVIVWDLKTGKELHAHPTLGRSTRNIAFLPGSRIVLICNHSEIRSWDVAAARGTGERDLARGVGLQMALSPDGRVLALTNQFMGTTRLIEIISGQEICRFGDDRKGIDIAFSPNGRTLALGTEEGTIRLLDWPTGRECLSFRAHRRGGWCLTFSPDGKRLASVGGDLESATAVLWDLADATAQPLRPVKAGARQIETWCETLDGADAASAYRAVWNLVAVPEPSLAALKTRITGRPAPARREITRLIADLDSEDFQVREKAQRGLLRAGDQAIGELQTALKDPVSPEQKRRLQHLLKTLRTRPIPSEDLFAVRAVMVLEQIGDRKARSLLRELAEGDDKARLTQEARSSLKRLDSQHSGRAR